MQNIKINVTGASYQFFVSIQYMRPKEDLKVIKKSHAINTGF